MAVGQGYLWGGMQVGEGRGVGWKVAGNQAEVSLGVGSVEVGCWGETPAATPTGQDDMDTAACRT